jgi:hypothetical protein
MANTVGARLAFEKAKAAVSNAGFSLGTAVLSQSYLRSEVVLSTTQTLYQFPILINDNSAGAATNTSRLLNLQDAFYVSELALFFAAPSSATDTTFQLCTYPNATQFTGGSADALNTFYNGSMSLTINNRQIMPNWDLYRHYNVPMQQQTADADYTGSGIDYLDQQTGSSSGFVPVEPGIVLVGSKQNVLQVALPAALAAVQANSRAVLVFRGHLAQNVTSVR